VIYIAPKSQKRIRAH